MPAGWASDRLGRRPIALVAMLGSGGAAVGFLLAGPSAPVATLVLLGLACSGLASPLYGLGAGLINDRLDSGDAVAAAGALLLTWSLGATIVPLVGGAVMEAIGPAGLFWYLSAVLATMALFTVWRMALRPEPPREQRSAFVPAATPPPGLSGAANTDA
jgi:MFS family permease